MNSINTIQLLTLLRQKQWQEPLYWNWGVAHPPIFLQAMLRDLISRRATLLGEYQGQKSIVKVFYDKQGGRHARREMKGLQLLQQCGVATSRVLAYKALENAVLLVLSYLNHTVTVASTWVTWDEPQKQENLSFLLEQLAKMYENGVCHNDLHLNNILTDKKQLYIIDGMDVKRAKPLLSYNARLNNLADFFMQFSIVDQKLLWSVLTEKALRFFPTHMAWTRRLQRKITQKSLYKQRKMQQKVWRQCSAFTVGKLGAYEYVVATEHKEFLMALFHQQLQSDKISESFRYQSGCCDWMVRCSGRLKAKLSWENANRLQLLHILTPKPIGLVRGKGGASQRSDYFLTEYMPVKTLEDYLDSVHEKQQDMIGQVVQTLQALKQSRLCYRDFKNEYFQVCEDKLVLFAVSDLRVYPWKYFFTRAFNKTVQQFLDAWKDTPVLQQAFANAFKESNLL